MEHSTDMELMRSFVGDIQQEQLAFVDCFLSNKLALFMPVGGYCGYSISRDHTHPVPMFTVHFDDLGLIEFNGKIYRSIPDHTFYLAEGLPHHELEGDRPARFLALFVRKEIIEKIARQYGLNPDELPSTEMYSTPGVLVESLKGFIEEYRLGLPGKEEVLDGIALRVYHILVRMMFRLFDESGFRKEAMTHNFLVNRVIEHIYKHLSEKIKLEELAFLAGISVSHFTQVFKNETGETPHRYIMMTRLQQARRLLLEGKQNLTEVALECGFSSSAHLSFAFQKEFSISPSQYRKTNRLSVKSI